MKLAYGLLPLGLVACSSSTSNIEKPNVLLLMVDDLNDWIGVMEGYPAPITPNLDALMSRGTLFTNAHAAQPVSNASRNALMSGLHPSSTGWYLDTKVMRETYDKVMHGNKMMPQYFKDNGYNTYAVGKIFHDGVTDYPDRKDDFWTEYAPSFWGSQITERMRETAYGYRGYMFYPFTSDGGQLVQAYGVDTVLNYYKEHNRFYSLCGGPLDEIDIPEKGMFDEQIAAWAVDKLETMSDDPFMLAVGFIRPHVPYTAPRKYFDMYDFDKITMPEIPDNEFEDIPLFGKAIAFGSSPDGDWESVHRREGIDKELVHAYLACVTFMDEQIGKVMKALEESGKADETIIVLCSDHGQHLGEKRHYRKQALWEESTRVPLMFCLPKAMGGKAEKYAHPASLLDIYPTLVELCGLPHNEYLQGRSLCDVLENPNEVETPPVLITWKYHNFAVRSKEWRYIQYRDGSEELYNHEVDPGEYTNLAGDPQYASVILHHQQVLPDSIALPAGTTEFKGDAYEARIKTWTKNDSIPMWLR